MTQTAVASSEAVVVLLFAGQGSDSHLTNDHLLQRLLTGAPETKKVVDDFLNHCVAAWQTEIAALSGDEKAALGLEKCDKVINGPRDLLMPPAAWRSNAVVESTTFYVHQLVDLIGFLDRNSTTTITATTIDPDPDPDYAVAETVGVCSGIIPAILAAAFSPSRALDDFLIYAVDGFRLAFWIGVRTSLFCHYVLADQTKNDIGNVPGPWALTVRGLSAAELRDKVDKYNADTSRALLLPLRVSATLDDTVVSLVGDPHTLQDFRNKTLGPSVTARHPPIHGYFHGGTPMLPVVRRVLSDVTTRRIVFPSWERLQVPVRSAVTGQFIFNANVSVIANDLNNNDDTDVGLSLLETALRHVLVEPVDWKATREAMLALCETTQLTPVHLISLGPNTVSLGLSAHLESASHSHSTVPGYPGIRIVDDAGIRRDSIATPTPNSLCPDDAGSDSDIAIVGLGLDLPGGRDAAQFWETLCNGLSTVSEIPRSRFDTTRYTSPPSSPGSSTNSSKNNNKTDDNHQTNAPIIPIHGNFLPDPFGFDAAFFRMTPREAVSTDPQQRLLLHTAQRALQDAGYAADTTATWARTSFGVFVGAATADYADNLRCTTTTSSSSSSSTPPAAPAAGGDVYYGPGTLRAFMAGRVSFAFGFEGPAVVVDTACSSSLVAIHHACRALRDGECTAALAGGVNVISSPDMYIGLSRAHFLSPTGQCRPFDAAADGYCRAEGCGLVVLKRLAAARAEGDRVLAVVRGVEINQSGLARSITRPDPDAQVRLFERLLERCGVMPGEVNVVEAHGTGTQAGDCAETSSLRAVFSPSRTPDNPLHLCSVKGNIGHAEAASGVASLAKLLLMLKHRQIPPQASLDTLNPRLGLADDPILVVPRRLLRWSLPPSSASSASGRRYALLNNFGAAGSNAALLLQEAPDQKSSLQQQQKRSCHVLNISAKTTTALETLRRGFISILLSNNVDSNNITIADICYSANARRDHHIHFRLSVRGRDAHGLAAQLRDAQISPVPALVPAPVHGSSLPAARRSKPKTVFIFSGQGGAHPGMGAELLATSPEFDAAVRACDEILVAHGFPGVRSYLAGETGHGDYGNKDRDQIVVTQCACFVLQHALARLLRSWGIEPDLVAGISLGEYAAFALGGILANATEALLLVAQRARLIADLCDTDASALLACRLGPIAAEDLIASLGLRDSLSVACYNAPEDTVIAGPHDAVDAFAAALCNSSDQTQTQTRTRKLDLPLAFHSRAVDPVVEPFHRLLLASGSAPESSVPVVSTASSLYGRVLRPGEAIPADYFARQMREPVQFTRLAADVAREFAEAPAVVFLEIGPSATGISRLRWAFDQRDGVSFVPCLNPKETAWQTLSAALQTLYLQRYPVSWRPVYEGTQARFVDCLPVYPLASTTFVVPYTEPDTVAAINTPSTTSASATSGGKRSDYSFPKKTPPSPVQSASTRRASDSDSDFVFDADMGAVTPFMEAHRIAGRIPLCPASVYVELALEAVDKVDQSSPSQRSEYRELTDLRFEHPFVPARDTLSMTTALHRSTQDSSCPQYTFTVTTSTTTNTTKNANTNTTHCTGTIPPPLPATKARHQSAVKSTFVAQRRHSTSGPAGVGAERFSARTIYELIFPRVVAYAPPLATLGGLCVSASGREAFGIVQIPVSLFPAVSLLSMTRGQEQGSHSHGKGKEKEGQSRMVCHPALIDVLLHAPGFVANARVDLTAACICTGVDRLVVHVDLDTQEKQKLGVYCSLVPVDASTIVAEAYLIDETGNVVAWAEGMTFRIVSLAGFEARLRGLCRGVDAYADGDEDGGGGDEKQADGHIDVDAGVDVDTDIDASTDPDTPPTAEALVIPILRETCGLAIAIDIDPSSSLDELGVDSLMLIELADAVRRRVPGLLSALDLASCRTVRDIADTVGLALPSTLPSANGNGSALRDIQTGRSKPEPPVIITRKKHQLSEDAFPIRLGPTHVPGRARLYLFHDGSGRCAAYARLNLNLKVKVHGGGVNLFGVHSLDFGAPPDPSIATLEQLAARYIDVAGLRDGGEEVVILGGWSFGGVLAFEVARQLALSRTRTPHAPTVTVAGVVLLDSPPPRNHDPLPPSIITHIVGLDQDQDQSENQNDETRKKTREAVAAQFRRHAALLASYTPRDGDEVKHKHRQQPLIPCVLIQCTRPFDTTALLPAGAGAGASHPWLSDGTFRARSAAAWADIAGVPHVPVLDIDCDHFGLFAGENVDQVSRHVDAACEYLLKNVEQRCGV